MKVIRGKKGAVSNIECTQYVYVDTFAFEYDIHATNSTFIFEPDKRNCSFFD